MAPQSEWDRILFRFLLSETDSSVIGRGFFVQRGEHEEVPGVRSDLSEGHQIAHSITCGATIRLSAVPP